MLTNDLCETLPLVFQNKARIADRFYQAMFRLAPETRAHFGGGFGEQKSVFAMLIVKIAQSAGNPDALEQIARHMVEVHRRHGISAADFRIAGRALREALESSLSEGLTVRQLARWTRVADTLIQRMIALSD
ncbi:globin [Antarcticimicrobium luteum]|uniref:Globin n=1 Tax=Antarcticimicrobium luteum TaxID=2547397 RepID=A0A4R5UXA6_9RHOB|nr:globin [Antarcticimicrobium luteum]TDK43968.1 globin [Antarcticimicrobium luteum]